jgi:cytoskeletal protein CcmA (bactofilin family)
VNYFSQGKSERDLKTVKAAAPEVRFEAPKASTKSAAPEILSTFGHGMLITGNIVCAGAVQIFGRVVGEVHAAHVVICEGATVEGKLTAQEAVIQGTFNGTIHGNSVKLQGSAAVDGEIFNKSLTIEENALFEGVSRRLDRPVEAPSVDRLQADKAPVAPATAPDYMADIALFEPRPFSGPAA